MICKNCCHHININSTEFMYLMLSTWRSIWIKGEVQKGRHSSFVEADLYSAQRKRREMTHEKLELGF